MTPEHNRIHPLDAIYALQRQPELENKIADLERQLAEARAERDEARLLVTEANNSLYGSQGYFHSLTGGAFDKYHLASGIEKLKDSSRKQYVAEAERVRLAADNEWLRGALTAIRDVKFPGWGAQTAVDYCQDIAACALDKGR